MNSFIGFILLTHQDSPQIERLIEKLNIMFDFPLIVWHHDFSQSPLPITNPPPNVEVIQPSIPTRWAGFSIVEATIKCIESMYHKPNSPDWFVLLSGSDYPIKSAKKIIDDLMSGPYDAYIHHELVSYGEQFSPWIQHCHKRYCSVRLRVPILNRRLTPKIKTFQIDSPWLVNRFLPFSDDFKCYAGAQWFCANRHSAEQILASRTKHQAFETHYKSVLIPDESYFHTLLCNAPHLKICGDPLRLVNWTPQDACHPQALTIKDLPKLTASHCHFARKLDMNIDSELLNELDAITE